MRCFRRSFFVLLILTAFHPAAEASSAPNQSVSELEAISRLIFANECSSKDACLLSWNEGEHFPSLGIGHFIWYPKNYQGRFVESFPKMMEYLASKGETLDWYERLKDHRAPWKNKKAFEKALRKNKLNELRDFLMRTKPLQTQFMAERAKAAIPRIIQAVPETSRLEIRQKLSHLIHSKSGLYPLIDYVNFSGEGLAETERYRGQGWGLLQVLETMKTPKPADDPAAEFAAAAEKVQQLRVTNAPADRHEERWLLGWKNRMKTYADPSLWPDRVERSHNLREQLIMLLIQDMKMSTGNMYLENLDETLPIPVVSPAAKAS